MQGLLIFLMGASGYGIIELLWRGYTHWTMLLTGGTAFFVIYYLFSGMEDTSVVKKAFLGGALITAIELVAGTIINVIFGLDVWDYSNLPYNFYGQICLPYSILWIALSFPLAYFCAWVKNILEKPQEQSAIKESLQ